MVGRVGALASTAKGLELLAAINLLAALEMQSRLQPLLPLLVQCNFYSRKHAFSLTGDSTLQFIHLI